MKKFEVKVIVEKTFTIEIDETKYDEKWMGEFREVFYPFDSLEDHAEFLAKFQFEGAEDDFIEGYGYITRNGELPFSFEKDRVPVEGINIVDSDDTCVDTEIKELT